MSADLPDHAESGRHAPSADARWLAAWTQHAWRAWRAELLALLLVACSGIGWLTHAVLALVLDRSAIAAIGVASATLVLAIVVTRRLRDVRPMIDAAERDTPSLRNALIAWHESRGSTSSAVAHALAAQARAVLEGARNPRPVSWPVWASVVACCLIAGVANQFVRTTPQPRREPPLTAKNPPSITPTALRWRVTVTPPPYTHQPAATHTSPSQVEALVGSTIALEFHGWRDDAVARLGVTALTLTGTGRSRTVGLVAAMSDVLLVESGRREVLASVTMVVRPDEAPAVRITQPAADLRRSEPKGAIAVHVTTRDDLGLRDLRLRFTKVSGSGESVTFEDGEWPLAIHRRSAIAWDASHTIDLSSLGLAAGDSIVYRAVAQDGRVGPEGAAESERYLIEIVKPGALTAGDASLPEPEERYALSQRMVIQLTERLLERRPRLTDEQYRQEAAVLAIAQRRVRAEFVFMLGGEVEDEVEEAAHSHELEAGRLDNRGQNELTTAVRQMSQAEARLSDALVREALPYEYRALAALQAAFGKARYFMRTLPAPGQIDMARRLTGDRSGLVSASWSFAPLPAGTRAAAMALLARLDAGTDVAVAALLPALVALDREHAGWVSRVQDVYENEGRPGLARLLRARLLAPAPSWFALPLPRSAEEAAVTSVGPSR